MCFTPGFQSGRLGGPGVSPGYWTAGRRRDRFRSVTGPGWLPGSCVPALGAAVSGWAGYWWLVAVVEFHSAAAPSVAGGAEVSVELVAGPGWRGSR